MKHLLHCMMVVCTVLAVATTVEAGNVPQYQYQRAAGNYAEFSDGTSVQSKWGGCTLLFPDGTETDEECTKEGFPIGFDFKLGGRTFNQFAISNYGVIYFGKDAVSFNGRAHFCFAAISTTPAQGGDKPNSEYYNTFYTGMAPKQGIYSGNISYKTTGETGNRICTVQFKNMLLNEGSQKGKYSLQLRLYEKDNKIEMAFKELETCYTGSAGFYTGIRGCDDDDSILLTGTGLAKDDIHVSSTRVGNLLDNNSYINWDESDYDGHAPYQITHCFTPENNPVAPSDAPLNMTIRENNGALSFACDKAENAKATVLLYSTSPIADSDLPTDGETFNVGTTFGNSTVLYYGDREHISASLSRKVVTPATTYYVCAISANGTPAFNRIDKAEANYTTTQKAPDALQVTTLSTTGLQLTWTASFPVIIAVTGQCMAYGGYTGQFGQPDENATTGSEITGGGKIIYIGDASEFTYEECPANQIQYFKAWTLTNNLVSSTGVETHGIPFPSFPYNPNVENYPQSGTPEGWTYEGDEYRPILRDYDHAATLMGSLNVGITASLFTPELPLDRTSKLTFEYALETAAKAEGKDSKGYKSGVFGDKGGIKITGNGDKMAEIKIYSGTMVPTSDGDGYNTGSSSFEKVEVNLPALTTKARIGINASAETFSKIFLRNIRIEATGPSIIEARNSGNTEMSVWGGESIVHILSATDGIVGLYGIDGCQVATLSVKAGIEVSLPIKAGIYLVNGQKVIVL